MTVTNFPSANPGGENTWLVRQSLFDWLDAQHLPDVGSIEVALQSVQYFDEFVAGGSDGNVCMLMLNLPEQTETRGAHTGPINPGGKDIHYDAEIFIRHRGLSEDNWDVSQRSYDRVKDAILDALRGRGRDLGRPDVILQVGEGPEGIRHRMDDPVSSDGFVDRWGVIRFTVQQYLPTFIPSEPQ